jgi:small subunit ribosomal protein S6
LTSRLYETMFLLDNQVVREDWTRAKSMVLDVLAKHGAKVHSARRWDERKLAYPIEGRKRATFLLSYFEMENEHLIALRRDLELNERVLRYLVLQVEKLPEGELDKAQAEQAADFVVPAPPADDAPEPERVAPQTKKEGDEEVAVPELDLMAVEES